MDKVKFGLSNVHWAKQTKIGNVISFENPKPWPGAVSLSMDPQGNTTKFRADNIDYYVSVSNNGYEGDYECAMVPEAFREEILGDIKDGNGVLMEVADAISAPFALLFEFDGDAKKQRRVLYNCVATRPPEKGNTTEESVDPDTDTLTLTATSIYNSVLDKEIIKAATTSTTTPEAYAGWYEKVYMPTAPTAEPGTE